MHNSAIQPMFHRLQCALQRLTSRSTTAALLLASVAALAALGDETGPTPRPNGQPYVAPSREEERNYPPMVPRKYEPDEALSEEDRVKLPSDEVLSEFKFIEDEAPLRSEDENPDEHRAWRYTLVHARSQSLQALAKYSLRDLAYANLVEPIHVDYLRQLIHIEGRLSKVTPLPATRFLREAEKIDTLYEGWIYPDNERWPVEVLFSELPPDIEKGVGLSYRVKFDGYFFKVIHAKTGEEKSPGKFVWRKYPLLIGRAPVLIRNPAPFSVLGSLLPIIIGVAACLLAAGFGLTMWFRKGDRRVAQIKRDSQTNPFPVQQPAPLVEPEGWEGI